MKKLLNISIVLFFCLSALSLASCSDDDNNYEVSQEWRDYQASWVEKVRDAVKEGVYTPIRSESRLDYIYWRTSDYITNNMAGDFDKDGPEALPEVKSTLSTVREEVYETDQVELRYEGWYYNSEGNKVIFDSTETGTNGNNQGTSTFTVNGTVDGFKTALLDMKVGDEWIVCIPYKLGYGTSGSSSIPGYTTLFFDIKLLRNITAEKDAGIN